MRNRWNIWKCIFPELISTPDLACYSEFWLRFFFCGQRPVATGRDGGGGGRGGGCSPFPAPSIGGQEINRYTKQKSNCPLPFHQKIDDLKKKKYWKTIYVIKKVSYYQMTEKKIHLFKTCYCYLLNRRQR